MKFTQVFVERCPTCGEAPYLSMKESYGGMDVFKLECPNHYAVEDQGYIATIKKWNYWIDIMREAKAMEDSIEFWSDLIGKEKEMIDDVFEETVRRSRTDGVFGQHRKYFDPNAVEAERKLHENHFELELEGEMPVEEPSPAMREAVKKFAHEHHKTAHEHHKTGCGCDYDPRDANSSWYSQEVAGEKNEGYGVSRLHVDPDGSWNWVPLEEGEEDMLEDNWVHRSEGMVCATCMFYVPKALRDEADGVSDVGRCRRHAPTMSGFPVVFETDWCGDHKLDEEKI